MATVQMGWEDWNGTLIESICWLPNVERRLYLFATTAGNALV